MTPFLLANLGSSELFLVLIIPFAYVLPIWFSFRKYGEGQGHWRLFSIIGSLFFSWLGYILVSCLHSGLKGYLEGRTGRAIQSK